MRSFRDPDELKDAIRRTKPDALYSSLFVSPLCMRLAERFNIPHIVYVHSFELCPPSAREVRRWGMAEEWSPIDPDSARLVLAGADVVVANSPFMQRRLLSAHGVKSVVVPPEIDLRRDPRSSTAEVDGRPFITSVCGHGSKGADVVLELARRFPAEQFLVTGHVHRRHRPRFEAAPNITIWPFGPAKKFLAASRILLAPSQWPEPFGPNRRRSDGERDPHAGQPDGWTRRHRAGFIDWRVAIRPGRCVGKGAQGPASVPGAPTTKRSVRGDVWPRGFFGARRRRSWQASSSVPSGDGGPIRSRRAWWRSGAPTT